MKGWGRTNTYDFTDTDKSTENPVCQICTIVGYTADWCRHRFYYNYKPPPPKHLAAYVAEMEFATPDGSWTRVQPIISLLFLTTTRSTKGKS